MTHVSSEPITIRAAHGGDGAAVARLAALDSAEIPGGKLLLAEAGGELRAALSLHDGAVVADPFRRTADLVRLLRLRADLLAETAAGRPAAGRGAWRRRLRLRRRRRLAPGLARTSAGLPGRS